LIEAVIRGTADVVVASSNKVKLVPVEEQYTERAFVEPGREPYEAERRESKLVQAFCQYLRPKGYEVKRRQPLRCLEQLEYGVRGTCRVSLPRRQSNAPESPIPTTISRAAV
jgi:hypothetical protein